MKVIGAGLPRTGTLSQKVALEMLGFGPCYHMVNVLTNLPLSKQWSGNVTRRQPQGQERNYEKYTWEVQYFAQTSFSLIRAAPIKPPLTHQRAVRPATCGVGLICTLYVPLKATTPVA